MSFDIVVADSASRGSCTREKRAGETRDSNNINWITMSPDSGVVPPDSLLTVDVEISIEEEAQTGEYYEINICLAGDATVIAGKEVVITPGAIVYGEPQTTYRWQGGEHNCLLLYLWLSVDPPIRLPEPSRWPVWPWVLQDATLMTEESRSNIHGWAEQQPRDSDGPQ